MSLPADVSASWFDFHQITFKSSWLCLICLRNSRWSVNMKFDSQVKVCQISVWAQPLHESPASPVTSIKQVVCSTWSCFTETELVSSRKTSLTNTAPVWGVSAMRVLCFFMIYIFSLLFFNVKVRLLFLWGLRVSCCSDHMFNFWIQCQSVVFPQWDLLPLHSAPTSCSGTTNQNCLSVGQMDRWTDRAPCMIMKHENHIKLSVFITVVSFPVIFQDLFSSVFFETKLKQQCGTFLSHWTFVASVFTSEWNWPSCYQNIPLKAFQKFLLLHWTFFLNTTEPEGEK